MLNGVHFIKNLINNNMVCDFLIFFKIQQLKFQPAGNIARLNGMFFSVLFWASGGQDRLPSRRQLNPNSA